MIPSQSIQNVSPTETEPALRNLRLDIAYNGYDYHGWQVQPGMKTIQGSIEQELSVLFQTETRIFGASRTDAGVHARGQVAHCLTAANRSCPELTHALNKRLPIEIHVKRIREVPPDFHARNNARGKHYRYRIWISEDKPLFDYREVYWHPVDSPQLEAMRSAARQFEGIHDFSSFASNAKRPEEDKTRHITKIEIHECLPEIVIDVFGVSFLYKMVRGICGTLLDVLQGKSLDIPSILKACDRSQASRNLPGKGLSLMEVYYGPNALPERSESFIGNRED